MKTLLYILIIALLFNCNRQDRTTHHTSERIINTTIQASVINKYLYENAFHKQIIEIKNISEIEIEFKTITEDKKTGEKSIIQGIAKRNINEDPEIDINEEGEDYYSIQYVYTVGECKLLIRIEEDKKVSLKLDSFRCYDLPGKSNGLFTINVLLRRIN